MEKKSTHKTPSVSCDKTIKSDTVRDKTTTLCTVAEANVNPENDSKDMERYLKLHIANHRPG